MPELRYNLATKDWVIIAIERAKRPEDFSKAAKTSSVKEDTAANCPFCPGHEAKATPEIFAVRDPVTAPNTPGWQVRVVPNAFPALQSSGEPTRAKSAAGFMKMNGVGIHEVIIESPEHDKVIATMDQGQVEKIFEVYKARFVELSKDPRIDSVILFKNHGRGAGTSLSHPHSQVIALPVIPKSIHERLEIGREHFDAEGSCIYCDTIKMEKAEGERIIVETDNFIAFVPYAPRMPFEIWVLPKFHSSNFDEITMQQCKELAMIMQSVLGRLYRAVGNPDFNYAIYSAPCRERNMESYHWHIKIFPRIAALAGFEVGSGVAINTVVPENAAKYLREG
ncbi:MAG: galactose-1-phosphate uridylyltransferase [Candidatus Margulisiibacteriota bacterium]